jgi:hypothetical protein
MKLSHFVALAALATIVEGSCSGGSALVTKKHKKAQHRIAKAKQSLAAANSTSTSTVKKIANPKHRTKPSSNSTLSGISKNNIFLGMVPDEGDAGGQRQSMSQLNKLLGAKSATYGWYGQAQSGTAFDGSQLLSVLDDVKSSGAIFEPAVMPTGGWQGLTSSDNSQAVNICNVMKKFTDQGIEVRLRFGHEVNWYQTDGTYTGGPSDFKAGWSAVAKACKKIAPSVKMFFTPNVASLDQYEQFYPDDPSTVDLIGIDYYPQSLGGSAGFVNIMKPFHDKYTSATVKFAIGETGLGFAGSAQERVQWLSEIMSPATAKAMPNFVSISWFNFQKGYDFMIVDPNDSSTTSATKKFLGI